MTGSSYRYIFRFCCDPGFNDREETELLLRFAEQSQVDDVAVFANVEELNTGHMTYQEQETYLSLMRSLSDVLKEKGITLSVNQWHSVMHADLGKELPPSQPFRRMVDPYGHEAKLCVCPLCEKWQEYISGIYARYAELDASILWVEDDFRLHNHDPLVWGGCFCDEHMKLYSRLAGKELTREEFVKGILKPGKPHPYRKIWLDVSRETLLSAARAISGAVRKVNPDVRIGLMSSVPFVHAAEGRDWKKLLLTLSDGCTPVSRIHLPAYQEQVPFRYMQQFNMVSMQCAAMLPRPCEIYPELENYPYSLFSKSRRFTRFQLLSSLPLDLSGMTIDLFDLNGNGIVPEEGWQQMLKEVKPFLCRMQDKKVFSGKKAGVQVLYSETSSCYLHTKNGTQMEELYPQEVFWAGLLGDNGIPFFYSDQIDINGGIIALSGQVLRSFNEQQIRQLIKNNTVLLNGDAASTLCDMGLGALACIKEARLMPQNGGEHTYEQTSVENLFENKRFVRASTVISCSDVWDITPVEGTQVTELSAFYDSFRRRTASAEVILDGRVILFPFGHFEAPNEIPPMLQNQVRRLILQNMLLRCGLNVPTVFALPHLFSYCYRQDHGFSLYLVNAASDETGVISLLCPFQPEKITVSASDKEGERIIPFSYEGQLLTLNMSLAPMETALIELTQTGDIRYEG